MKSKFIDSENEMSEDGKSISNMKKHNTADTSIAVYRELVRSGKIKTEQELVYELIKTKQPLTSRQIAYETSKERGNITRSLHDLVGLGRLKIAFTAKCEHTGKIVGYYALVDWVSDIEIPKAA